VTVRELLEAQGLDPQAVLDLELGGRRAHVGNYAEAHLVDGYLNIEVSLSPVRGAYAADPDDPRR
jgi:hypothetical protein